MEFHPLLKCIFQQQIFSSYKTTTFKEETDNQTVNLTEKRKTERGRLRAVAKLIILLQNHHMDQFKKGIKKIEIL